MARIFSSNPYNWFLIFIAVTIVLIIAMLNIFTYTYISITAFIICIIIGYFVIPNQMNFKAVLEIDKEGLSFLNKKLKIEWANVISVYRVNENQVIIEYKLNDDTSKTEEIDCNKMFISTDDILKLIEKYNHN